MPPRANSLRFFERRCLRAGLRRCGQGRGWSIGAYYDEDDVTEPNDTRIGGKDGSGWISRLGVRAHRTWVGSDGRKLQPYVTLNWWHDNVDDTLNFNTPALKNLYPATATK